MHNPTMRGKLFAGMMTLALTIATFAGPTDGDLPADAVKIPDNGPDTDRFVLVLLAEGYTAGQLGQFATDATVCGHAGIHAAVRRLLSGVQRYRGLSPSVTLGFPKRTNCQ